MATPEGRMKAKVTKMLKSFGEDVWYFYPGNNGFGKSGVPDIVACAHGVFFGIEVKADETKAATKLQQLQGSRIDRAGGHWFLVRSEDDVNMVAAAIQNLKEIVAAHELMLKEPDCVHH
jgi:hypothetical protein